MGCGDELRPPYKVLPWRASTEPLSAEVQLPGLHVRLVPSPARPVSTDKKKGGRRSTGASKPVLLRADGARQLERAAYLGDENTDFKPRADAAR